MPHTNPIGGAEFSKLMETCEGVAQASHIAVAVSGGADSMCLAGLLHVWGTEQGIHVTALTVDHGLRDGSADEAQQVKVWLSQMGLDHHVLTWKPAKSPKSAVQARARKARYDLMRDCCQSLGITHLFLAHHLGDQAETVLMRLKKKTTLYGLGAMAPVREDAGLNMCRPLLTVPKSRLLATLKAKDQDWIEDPSNQNMNFERVRTRALLEELAKEGVCAERLGKVSMSARKVCGILDKAADQLIDDTVVQGEAGALSLGPNFLKAAPRVYERALSKLLLTLKGSGYPPSPDKLKRLAIWLASGNTGARTLSGVLVRRWGTGLQSDIQLSAELPRKNCKKTTI